MSDANDERPLPDPPAPSAVFRGALGRRLAEEGAVPGRPQRLWLWIGLCAAVGVVLLLISAAGI